MSQWIINDIELYLELSQSLKEVYDRLSPSMKELHDTLEQLNRDIEVDLKESIDQQKKISKEEKDEESRLKQKIEALKGIKSQLEMLFMKNRILQTNHNECSSLLVKAENILNSFTEIGTRYFQLQANVSNHSSSMNATSRIKNNPSMRLLGDTFHFTKESNLDASALESIERNVINSSEQGNKISIDRISQSDFNLLEKNGYTIQEVKPNEFSAYKTIDD
jgi:hypothetical protein